MEALTLRAAIREAREACVPSRVQSVTQATPFDLVLGLGGRRGRHLVVSAHPEAPGLFVDEGRPAAPKEAGRFCLLARRRLQGLVLTAVESEGMERVARLRFAASAAEAPRLTLVGELLGRRGNLVLVEGADGPVLDAMRQIPEGGERTVLPGEPYVPPGGGGRPDLSRLSKEEFLALCRRARGEGRRLREMVIGLGPGLEALAASAPGDDEALFAATREVLDRVEHGALAPVVYPRRGLILPLPAAAWEGEECEPFDTLGAAASRAWRGTIEGEERRKAAAAVRRDLARLRKRLQKKADLLAAESVVGEGETALTEAGRALLASLDYLPRGAASFTCRDPRNPAGPGLTVALDPALDARRNAEALFRRAKKAKRRAESALGRLPAVRRELERTVETLDALPGLSLDELRGLGRAAGGRGGAGRRGGAGPAGGRGARDRRSAGAARIPEVREYRGEQWRILAGKSSRGNDYLTSKIALPGDYWFHARDVSGAHVVLKPRGSSSVPPPEAIRAAGQVAAWHSAARGDSFVDVAYTQRKHVRKARGQAPGKVLVPRSSTVRVRPGVPEGYVEVGPGE